MKDPKDKDLKLKEKESEVSPNAEALEADRELNPEELDKVAGGRYEADFFKRISSNIF